MWKKESCFGVPFGEAGKRREEMLKEDGWERKGGNKLKGGSLARKGGSERLYLTAIRGKKSGEPLSSQKS